MNAQHHENVTVYEIPGGMIPDRMLRVQGTIPDNVTSFQIYLQNGSELKDADIILNMKFQISSGPKLIMNSKENKKWGKEETKDLPIVKGQPFEMMLLCDKEDFKIAVNGKAVSEFRHRIPFNKGTHIVTENKIQITSVGMADPN